MFAVSSSSPTPKAASPSGTQNVSDARQHKRSLAKEMQSKFSSFFASNFASSFSESSTSIADILAKPKEAKLADILPVQNIGENVVDLKTHIAMLSKQLPPSLQSHDITDGFGVEFDALMKQDHQIRRTSGMFLTASKSCNSNRNRFRNVLPNETTRVSISPTVVQSEEGEELTDYINANFVSGKEFGLEKLMYIATQAPMSNTVIDFYQMCWEQNAGSIVVLTNEAHDEGEQILPDTPSAKKSFFHFDANSKYDSILSMNEVHKYWPTLMQSSSFGPFHVTNIEEEQLEDDICVRKLEVKMNDQLSRTITMYHYTGWPDMGVPKSPKPFLKLIKRLDVEQIDVPDPKPIVVHCIAGIGRTGTFCTVHITYLQMKEYIARRQLQQPLVAPFKFNVYNMVKALKSMRLGMVQKREQYAFCYTTILMEAMELGVVAKDDSSGAGSLL